MSAPLPSPAASPTDVPGGADHPGPPTDLAGLLANLPGMVYRHLNDAPRTLIYASDGCLALTGYAKTAQEHHRAAAYHDLVHHDDRAALREQRHASLAARTPSQHEYRIVHRSGATRWVSDRAFGHYDAAGSLLSVEGFITDITTRHLTETAHRESAARWHFALEAAEDGVWDWDLLTGQTYFSPRWKTMLGYTAAEIADHLDEFTSRIHPEDWQREQTRLQAHLTGEAPLHAADIRLRCKDGSWKWIRSRGKVTAWLSPGRPRRMIGTHTDIDAAKRRDEAERSISSRLDLALRAGRFGTFQRNLRTGEAHWDERAWAIAGLPPRAAGPTRAELDAIFDPADHAAYAAMLARLQSGETTATCRLRYRRPSGEIRHTVSHAIAQPESAGPGVVITGLIEDLTEQLAAETARRSALERYNTIFHTLTEGLLLQQADGTVIECNPAAERIFGRPRSDLLGRSGVDPAWQTFTPDGRPLAGIDRPPMVALRTGRAVRDFEMGLTRPDGVLVWLQVNAEPICVAAGGPVGYVVVSVTDLTAQRLAERERRRANDRLQAAVIASRIVWWEWLVTAGDFRVNAFGLPCILGYNPTALAGLNADDWLAHTHPDDRPHVASALADALAGRSDQWICDHRFRTADGAWRWVRNIGRVTERADDGAPLLMVGTTQDVHATRLTDEQSKLAAQRLQVALGASHMGVWRYNLQTCSTEWDERIYELHGLPLDADLTQLTTFQRCVHPADWPGIMAAWGPFYGTGERTEYTYRVVLPGGTLRHIRSVATMLRDALGRPEWITGINEDITAEQTRRLELRDLHERLELALRSSRFGVWELHLDTQHLHWDETMLHLYGLTREAPAGSMEVFRQCVHPADREHMDRAFQGLLHGQPVEHLEFRITRRSDGAERVLESYSYLHVDSAGAPLRVVGLNRDITAQKAAERQRRQLEDQLVQSQKLETLGTLAGGIAHDFNNLLTGMLGFTELALHALPAQHEAAAHLQHARHGSLRARDMVKRLLLFARRAPETARQTVQLRQIVADTLPLLTATLPTSIVIHTETSHTTLPVLVDAGQIQQVLTNLCINAGHAIGAHQGRIALAVRPVTIAPGEDLPCPAGDYVCLTVTDNGCGMDSATLAKIFDPFFTTKAPGEGTGLGLSIVHGIVHDHGGCLRVRSAPGAGTTFEIYLPVSRETRRDPSRPSAPRHSLQGAGRRLLLADDEEPVRVFVGDVLRRAGFVVELCENGTAAVACFAAAPASFSLALLDLSMPGRNGFEVITDLRALRPDLPICLMSGDHERYGRAPLPADNPVIRLAKPFSGEELFTALRHALAGTAAPPAA